MTDRWLIDSKQMKVLMYEPKVLGEHIIDVVAKSDYDLLVRKYERFHKALTLYATLDESYWQLLKAALFGRKIGTMARNVLEGFDP